MSRYLFLAIAATVWLPQLASAGDYDSSSVKTQWNDKDGQPLPGQMEMVDFGSMPLTLTQRRGTLFVNSIPESKVSKANLEIVEAVTGANRDTIVDQLLKQRGRPARMQVDIAVLRQIGNGQLIRMPVAMLDPAGQLAARRLGQQILEQKRLQAQLVMAQRRRLATAMGTIPTGTNSSAADFEQEGEFEGQFGDQDGPDGPELSGGKED
ncbi:hypothetical protein [Planctomycetes bacterium TBK1r]|uniref:Uncharacterized protein n=1 Tax=Stieleria magnilauensis TaxID=2527963 RepID=A0ABX5XUK6_9BACT|nr:hypothetical protein TBK1r_47250 [Planctomycetes bacterium TBK1r]